MWLGDAQLSFDTYDSAGHKNELDGFRGITITNSAGGTEAKGAKPFDVNSGYQVIEGSDQISASIQIGASDLQEGTYINYVQASVSVSGLRCLAAAAVEQRIYDGDMLVWSGKNNKEFSPGGAAATETFYVYGPLMDAKSRIMIRPGNNSRVEVLVGGATPLPYSCMTQGVMILLYRAMFL